MKKRIILGQLLTKYIVIIFIISIPLIVHAGAIEEWVKRYNGPGDGDDVASALVVDSAGNVYVTGTSDGGSTGLDYATLKYDTNGNKLWENRYNGTGNNKDTVRAMDVDSLGNVYVTGECIDPVHGNYCLTMKYDTNGFVEWMDQYSYLYPNALAVFLDADLLENVYITGSGPGNGGDYHTIKYVHDGILEWYKGYSGPGCYPDDARAIAVDSIGNVYVTGIIWIYFNNLDYATVKYDINGNELWARQYGEGALDIARAIAVDSLGNVYVSGDRDGGYYLTIKYDTDGNRLWVKRYDGAEGRHQVSAIAVDSLGNVYVTGWNTSLSTRGDYATVKYDTHGTQLWVKKYNGPENANDGAEAMVLDSAGNVYVTGTSVNPITLNADYATVKYDTDGTQLWVKKYNNTGNSEEIATAIDVDSSGNVYVTGYSNSGSGTNYDYATVKYMDCIDIFTKLEEIIETLVTDGVIAEELKNSLLSKVNNVQRSASKENICVAINQCQALINEVNGQRGRKISNEAADEVIKYADNSIECLSEELPPGETC